MSEETRSPQENLTIARWRTFGQSSVGLRQLHEYILFTPSEKVSLPFVAVAINAAVEKMASLASEVDQLKLRVEELEQGKRSFAAGSRSAWFEDQVPEIPAHFQGGEH